MEKLYKGIFSRNENCDRFFITTYVIFPFDKDTEKN